MCSLLNALADTALGAAGFAWGKPRHNDEDAANVEEEGEEEEEMVEIPEGGGGRRRGRGVGAASALTQGVEEAVEQAEVVELGYRASASRLLPLMGSGIDPAEWKAECERCRPALKVCCEQ